MHSLFVPIQMPLHLARFVKNAESSISKFYKFKYPASKYYGLFPFRQERENSARLIVNEREREREQDNEYSFRRVSSAEAICDQPISDDRDEQGGAALDTLFLATGGSTS